MRFKTNTVLALAVSSTLVLAAGASADNNYVFLSGGWSGLSDSDNEGAFNQNFLTGTGTTIPLNTPLPQGTPVGWTTEFDGGYLVSLGFGRSFGENFRGELELSMQSNDVSGHNNVSAAGIALAAEDAGVLIAGSANIGATVGAVVADGRGDVQGTYFMVNGYYDLATDSSITPYIGAGIGMANVDVTFNPSGVGIISDDATAFAYQLMVGLTWRATDVADIYAGYKYRATADIETSVSLFPANLDIENRSNNIEVGFRYRF